ncbi:exopolyphosphatase [Bacteroidetes bacterium endosymbiont of Geopemphigus sp.]|uniref:Ppx/GppA phosphatase family protein n=1 Tax=Bacteroidetes bacterium endosymbiont of Geopemphigus sp. TaxID=2047937 RepID=UPI000CD0C964|nr:exopolyphosphatase [Bacteroidetes bacterium endosymbiont of Geopemphigus sp.]
MKINNYAAIDLGSNALRLLISSVIESPFGVAFNKTALVRAPVRLGTDAFMKKKISAENIERVVDAMQSYALLMKVYDVKEYLAYATSAMRDARNSQEIIEEVRKRCDINIEVIDGSKEANIILNTELDDYIDKKGTYLYIDVGGGSTELNLFHKGKILASHSFPIGSVRLLNQLVKEDFLSSNVAPWLKERDSVLKSAVAIGSGGNINCLFKLSGKNEHTPLKFDEVKTWRSRLSLLTYEERVCQYHLKPDRADVIVPALDIYYSIMKYAGIEKIYIPKIGLPDVMIQQIYWNKPEIV